MSHEKFQRGVDVSEGAPVARVPRGGVPTVSPLRTIGCTCAREGISAHAGEWGRDGPTGALLPNRKIP